MRPGKLPLLFLLSLLSTILFLPTIALADDDDGDEYDVTARVVRISFVNGDVSLKRHDSQEWETARLNAPLVEGDTIVTAAGARVEIQIDARNFVRLASESVLRIETLRDDGVALSLSDGTATLRLASFDKEHEFFEMDGPSTTIAAQSTGLYRLDALRKGIVRLTVRDGGQARI